MQENQISQIPTVDSPQTTVIQTVDEKPKKNNFLVILLSILLVLSLAIAGFFAYQTQKLAKELSGFKNQNLATPTSEPESTFPMYTEPNNPTADWKTYKVNELGIEFKLPKQLGMLENSGKEMAGDTGTQFCMSFVGSLSFSLVKDVYAGSGPCGGGIFNLGTVSKDYSAGRGGGFGDLSGYIKDGVNYSARFVNDGKFPLPSYLISETKNINGVTALRVAGESKMSDYGGEQMELPTLGTPGKGYVGALINISSNVKYTGFNLSMEIKTKEDEIIFDQILSTFKFTN